MFRRFDFRFSLRLFLSLLGDLGNHEARFFLTHLIILFISNDMHNLVQQTITKRSLWSSVFLFLVIKVVTDINGYYWALLAE